MFHIEKIKYNHYSAEQKKKQQYDDVIS